MTTRAIPDLRSFDARLRGYHDRGIDDVLELVSYLRSDGDSVIAGGSLSIGLGNRLSDVDVVISGEQTQTSVVPLQHWAGSLRVDVWTRSTEAIAALFAEAERTLQAPEPLLRVFGNAEQEQQLKLLHRIAFGLVLEGQPAAPPTSRTPQQIAADLLTREYAERLRESALIATLALAAGRHRSAAFCARQAVEEALHAVLHGAGVPFSGDKWLQEQLAGNDALQQLHATHLDLPRAAEQTTTYVGSALAAAERLLGYPLTLETLTHGLTWQLPAGLTLLPLSGDHVLAEPASGAGWTLTDTEAAAWQQLAPADGAPPLVPHPAAPDGAALLLTLHEQGIATPVWDRGIALHELTIEGSDA